jgi:hypothetical protein
MTCNLSLGCLLSDLDAETQTRIEEYKKLGDPSKYLSKEKKEAPLFIVKSDQACLFGQKEDPSILTKSQIRQFQEGKIDSPDMYQVYKQLIKDGTNVCQRHITRSYLMGEEDKHSGIFAADLIFVYWSKFPISNKPQKRISLPRQSKSKTPDSRLRTTSRTSQKSLVTKYQYLVCGFALVQEKAYINEFFETIPYVYLDVLCSRREAKLGSVLLQNILDHFNWRNNLRPRDKYKFLEIRALPALVGYYWKRGFQFGSPRFKKPYVLLENEEPADGLHMFVSLS